MKFATCNEYFENWPIEDVFSYAAEIGYDGVEIAPFTLADTVEDIPADRRRAIRRAAAEAGVEIVGLHWLLISPEGLYVNHVDDEIRHRTRDYFKALIQCCGDLGGEVMIIGSPKQRNVQDGWDYQETWNRTKQVFEDCLPLAEQCSVYLCIEPLSSDQTNFIDSAAEACKMVAEIDHPNFQTMVDTKAAAAEDKPHVDVIAEAGKAMRHVHVNDPNLRGPGFGDLEFAAILRALKDRQYEGYVSVEVFDFKPDPQTIAARSIGYLRGTLEGLAA